MSNEESEDIKEILSTKGVERLELEYKYIKKKKSLNKIGGSVGIIMDKKNIRDYYHWKACFIGPKETPYAKGLYFLEFKLHEDYPNKRPLARFKTKVWHPNVDKDTGIICLDYIKDKWTPDNTLRDAILRIFYLLTQPNFSSRLNTDASNDEEFKKKAEEYRAKYAYQSQEYDWMENYDNWDWN